jgi:hypothetical protein
MSPSKQRHTDGRPSVAWIWVWNCAASREVTKTYIRIMPSFGYLMLNASQTS